MRARLAVLAAFSLPIILPAFGAADEAADDTAICKAITSLPGVARPWDSFTIDGYSDFGRLPAGPPEHIPIAPEMDTAAAQRPSVIISHDEIWGEATVSWGPTILGRPLVFPTEAAACGPVRFLTPDVALADATWTDFARPGSARTQLLFVMKREGGEWKIDSVRVLAPKVQGAGVAVQGGK